MKRMLRSMYVKIVTSSPQDPCRFFHGILSLPFFCVNVHFCARTQRGMLSGYPGTRTTGVRVPEETGTRPRVRVIDLKMSGYPFQTVPVSNGYPTGYNSTALKGLEAFTKP